MPPGYHGRVLHADLEKGRLSDYPIPDAWRQAHVGGRGMAARILLREYRGRPADDPLAPSNVLTFFPGPLTGVAMPGSGRHVVAARSPLSGLYGEAYAGGFWATEFLRAGFDGLVVTGAAERPSYLAIVDGHAELRDASDLWGKLVSEVDAELLARLPGARVAAIGPAGENLVRFACVVNDRNRAAGRTGMGAVMGAKKLKAIVVKGRPEGMPKPADDAKLRAARKKYVGTLTDEGMAEFGRYGTPRGVNGLSHSGILPTRYWGAGSWDRSEEVSGERQNATILVGRDNCTACNVRCKRVVETSFEGERVDRKHGGPEYETIAAFASSQLVPSLDYVAASNKWCNEYGMDTISAGSAIAFAMEAKARGLLKDGKAPEYGDGKGGLALLHRIARREGLGDLLAQGTRRAAEALAAPELAVHVKGVELPMHEPRGKKGMGLSYAVSPRGANHMEGYHDTDLREDGASPELGVGKGFSRFEATPHKARVQASFENARSFVNSLVVCAFTIVDSGPTYNLGHVRDMLAAATGFPVDRDGMLAVGERNYQAARLFSIRMGATAADDDLPSRIRREALSFGKRREALTDADLATMKAAYYEARGWDGGGRPTASRLRALGLADAL
ncbi:MAG TPA: aldehyde ferredoxin oxidoreductase family protein [Candidatus Thermoplasmatota archaeon]|nr:aldehyde ferredoxin oxidoreductase family protein [Candidatus Thermoplasmatota archaeon]